MKHVFVVYKEKNFWKRAGNTGLTAFGKCTRCRSFVSFFTPVGFRLFSNGNMKFTILEPDGKAHDFVLTGDKLGQEALDKVRSTRNAELPNVV